jgi:hypothetical protein
MEASMRFFCSPNPVAPTAEITASCPLSAAWRSALEKSDLRTAAPDGNVAVLEARVKTVTLNSEAPKSAARMIWPMFPLACRTSDGANL